jgi:hypothetical protein
MTPSEYFYGPFLHQFHQFWHSLNECGSVSRVRSRYHTSRFAFQSDLHFSVVDLVVNPSNGLVDHLSDIPGSDQVNFLSALFYLILIDQVMYSHRQCDYAEFQARTLYPKMDRTVGYARTLFMANPYELFSDEILQCRGIERAALGKRFAKWANFIAKDLEDFFTKHEIGSTTWKIVLDAMLKDQGCVLGREGMMLNKALLQAANTILSDSSDPNE